MPVYNGNYWEITLGTNRITTEATAYRIENLFWLTTCNTKAKTTCEKACQ